MNGLVADFDPSRLLPRNRRPITATTTATASRYGEYRAERLRKLQPTSLTAWATDLLWSVAFPTVFGVGIAACTTGLLQIEAVDDWVKQTPISPTVAASLSTLVAFIISLRLGQNLTENSRSIEAFNDVCGAGLRTPLPLPSRDPARQHAPTPAVFAAINIAVWSRSLVSKEEFQDVTLPDGRGGVYQTTRLGLLLASFPYAVQFTYRGQADIPFERLPLGGDAALLARAEELTSSDDGFVGVSPFTALLMQLSEYIHNLEDRGEIQPSELGTLFAQIDALTAAEGKIASSVTFAYPRILRALLYGVFASWLFLLSLTEIAPASGWHSLWLVGLLSDATIGLYAMSNRYANPFRIRSKDSTQTPLIGLAAKETEVVRRHEPLHPQFPQTNHRPTHS